MKIVCESCSAKYSIADEKVAGRVFKIRCKKCGAAIVVRGDAGAADETSVSAGAGGGGFADYGGEAAWHVVVDGEQQGPLTPQQLGEMISANTIGWDAYVWREGFEDWKPAQDIEELVQAIMNPGGAAAEPADPFAAVDAPAAAAPAAAAKPSGKRDAGADLFAQSDAASPFGSGDDDVVASAPGPRVSAGQAMTGARNENSVLFSLSNLQALATGGGGGAAPAASAKPTASAPRAGHATGEGSGLIDIRALASATGVTGGPSMAAPTPLAPPKVDDLLSIGAPVGGLGSALAAPVIIPEKKESSGGNNGLIIAIAGLAATILLVGGGYVAYSMSQTDPAAVVAVGGAPAAAAGAITPGPAATTAGAPPAGTPPATGTVPPPAAGAVAGATPPAAEGTPAAGAVAAAGGTTAPAEEGGSGGGGSSSRRRSGGSGGSATAAAASGGSSGGTTAPATGGSSGSGGSGGSSGGSGGRSGGGDRSLDDLLGRALDRPAGGGGGAASGGGGGGGGGGASLPETPARGDVQAALTRVTPAVTACGAGAHGTAPVAITISGSTGRVTNAVVSGEFAGTPVGSCVARAVRGATFPQFSRSSFTVNFPFRL